MQLQIYLEPRTVCGCSFDVVNRGERSKGGGTAPRLWRRLSSPTLSSLVKKESGPRRAVAGLSGRYWFVEICKFVFKAWRSQVLRCACALGVSPIHKGAFGLCVAPNATLPPGLAPCTSPEPAGFGDVRHLPGRPLNFIVLMERKHVYI